MAATTMFFPGLGHQIVLVLFRDEPFALCPAHEVKQLHWDFGGKSKKAGADQDDGISIRKLIRPTEWESVRNAVKRCAGVERSTIPLYNG